MNRLRHACALTSLLLVSSCAPPAPQQSAPASAIPGGAEAYVTDFFATFNAHEWDKLAALYAEPAEFLDPSFGTEPVQQTRAQVAGKYAELAKLFPDLRDSVVAVYASGDRHVTVQFVSSGTAPDGSRFTLPICTVFTIENGLVTRDHTYYDNDNGK
jgi:ketosteroid isomerase-like protein